MQELDEPDRARLVERFGRRYEAGAVIFSQDEPAETCFIVQEGRIRLVKRIRSLERSLTVLRAGDMFGEDALLRRPMTRMVSAIALTPVTVLALDPETFGVMLAGNPQVAGRLMNQLVQRLRDAEEQLENSMIADHPSRIVNTLLRLASESERSDQGWVLTLTPLELSSRVGLDVDTVKQSVQQLRDGSYLQIVDERIVVPDLAPLRHLYHLLGTKEEVRGATD